MRFIVVVALAAACGCIEDVAIETGRAPLGDGLEDRMGRAIDAVIQQGEATITTLEAEIARLESRHQSKAAEIDDLVHQIEARRAELEQQHRNNLTLCLFFPDPSICVLAVVIENDSRMRDYNARLGAARTEQSRVQADIAGYGRRRDGLRRRIDDLRQSRARLVAAIRAQNPPGVPEAIAADAEISASWVQAKLTTELSETFREEIDLLVQIRDAAADLSASLDRALGSLRGIAAEVDQLVVDARSRFMDLLEMFVSEDADAAARDFLDDVLARRTRELLGGLDWPARELVEHLLAHRAEGEVDLESLRQALLEALGGDDDVGGGGGLPAPTRFEVRPHLGILDKTEITSRIDVPNDVRGTTVTLAVVITHSYRGDLAVRLQHAGLPDIVVHDRAGAGADDLVLERTYPLPAGSSPSGTWTLRVVDAAAPDVGMLHRWSVTIGGAACVPSSGAEEICGNASDDDCDGSADEPLCGPLYAHDSGWGPVWANQIATGTMTLEQALRTCEDYVAASNPDGLGCEECNCGGATVCVMTRDGAAGGTGRAWFFSGSFAGRTTAKYCGLGGGYTSWN